MNPTLQIQKLYKAFNTKQGNVIDNVDLTVTEGKVIAIIGESGSGKTTLSRLIAGLETPDQGTIKIHDEIVSDRNTFITPENRKIGMVFQDYALFPHLTVAKNIAYGIAKNQNIQQRIKDILALVSLEGYENRYPHQLSGGQQQRVALARALAPEPKLLILDEPFSNLDVALKLQLRTEVLEIIKKTKVTAIFVTHDIQDAMMIADHIVVLKNGKIIQQGATQQLFDTPNDEYVASLFSDIIALTPEDLRYFDLDADLQKRYAIRLPHFKIRPESKHRTEINVTRSIFLGTHYLNSCVLPNQTTINFISPTQLDGTIILGFEASSLLMF